MVTSIHLYSAYHDTLRKISFPDDDSPKLLQRLDKQCIVVRWCKCLSNVAQRRVQTLNIELIFHCDWNTMQRTY